MAKTAVRCVSGGSAEGERRPLLLVMGVSGSGKTTLGAALARALDVPFLDADALHTPAAVAKMASGVPLDDTDRAPWLAAVALRFFEFAEGGRGGIIACSALKRSYRQRILARTPEARLVFIEISPGLAHARMAKRTDHFMPPSLAKSQFEALEAPSPVERAFVVSAEDDLEFMVHRVLVMLLGPPLESLKP
jgi:gluconokinase